MQPWFTPNCVLYSAQHSWRQLSLKHHTFKILVHWLNICKEFKVLQSPVVLCLKVQGSGDPYVGAAPVTEFGSSLRKMEFFVFNLSWLTLSQTAITSILACSCQVGLYWICKVNKVLSPLCSDGNLNCHAGLVYFSYSLYKSLWNEDGGNPEMHHAIKPVDIARHVGSYGWKI